MCFYLYLLNINKHKHMTYISGDRERSFDQYVTGSSAGPWGQSNWQNPGFSGFAARCQSSEGCYLSRWEVLEVVEGQVCDQVSSVPDQWLMTSGDVRGGENVAVPHAKCSTLIQWHVPQVSVNSLPPRKNTITEMLQYWHSCFVICKLLSAACCERFH